MTHESNRAAGGMISVPRYLPRDIADKVFMEWSGRCETLWHDFIRAIEEAELAAPAEDVRAMVDEPVAYVLHKNGEVDWDQEMVISNTGGDEQDERWKWVPVYRHDQRQTVLPSPAFSHSEHQNMDELRGWNACLDEFKRLNKTDG